MAAPLLLLVAVSAAPAAWAPPAPTTTWHAGRTAAASTRRRHDPPVATAASPSRGAGLAGHRLKREASTQPVVYHFAPEPRASGRPGSRSEAEGQRPARTHPSRGPPRSLRA